MKLRIRIFLPLILALAWLAPSIAQGSQKTAITGMLTAADKWWWEFAEASGDVASSVGTFTLTKHGAPTYQAAGRDATAKAVTLGAVGDCFDKASCSPLTADGATGEVPDSFGIMMVLKAAPTNNTMAFYANGAASIVSIGHSTGGDTHKARVRIRSAFGNDYLDFDTDDTVFDSTYHLITVNYSNAGTQQAGTKTLSVTVDKGTAKSATSMEDTRFTNITTYTVGAQDSTGFRQFTGSIDEIVIRVGGTFTPTEIATVFDGGNGGGPLTAATISLSLAAGDKTPSKITITTDVASGGGTLPRTDTLQRSTDNFGGGAIATVTSPDTTVIAGTRYYYRISTIDAATTLVTSNVVEAVARWTAVYPPSVDANGFGVWDLSPTGTRYYVNPTTGNDGNTGLSNAQAKATITAGLALLTTALGDQLMLERSASYAGQTLAAISKDGYSEDYPLMIRTYDAGTPTTNRPLIVVAASASSALTNSGTRKWIGVSGIDFICKERKPGETGYDKANQTATPVGFRAGNCTGFYCEDCSFDHFQYGVLIDASTAIGFTLFGNRILYPYGGTNGSRNPVGNPHSQGIYATNVTYLRMEKNFIDHAGWHDRADFNESLVSATVTAATDASTFRVSVAADYATGYFNGCHVEMLFLAGQPQGGEMRNITSSTRVDATHQDIVLATPLRATPLVGQTLYLDEMARNDGTGGRVSTVVAGSTATNLIVDVSGRDYAAGYFVGGCAYMVSGAQAGIAPLVTADVRTSATRHTLTLSSTDDPLGSAPAAGDVVNLCNPQKNLGRRRAESHGMYLSVGLDPWFAIKNVYLQASGQDRKGNGTGVATPTNNFSWAGFSGSYYSGAGSESSYNVVYEPHGGSSTIELAGNLTGSSRMHHLLEICTGVFGSERLSTVGETPQCQVDHNTLYVKYGYGLSVSTTTTTAITAVSVTDNVVAFQGSANAYLVSFRPATFEGAKFTFARNKYFAADATPFLKNNYGDEISYATWTGAFGAGESGSVFAASLGAVGFVDPTRTAETYLTSIGVTPTVAGYRAALLANHRTNYNAALTADAMNDYLRAGFAPLGNSSGRITIGIGIGL